MARSKSGMMLRLGLPALFALTVVGLPAGPAAAAQSRMEFELELIGAHAGLVSEVHVQVNLGTTPLPSPDFRLTRSGSRFSGHYDVPAGVVGDFRGRFRLVLTAPEHPILNLNIYGLTVADAKDPRWSGQIRIRRAVTLHECGLEAVRDLGGGAAPTPAHPDVTCKARWQRRTRLYFRVPPRFFQAGASKLYLPTSTHELPLGTPLTLQGTLAGATTPSGVKLRAREQIHLGDPARSRARLVFRDWEALLRAAFRERLEREGVDGDTAEDASEVTWTLVGALRSGAQWMPPRRALGSSWIEMASTIDPAQPGDGESLLHEWTHEVLYQGGWQPMDPPNTHHRLHEPCSHPTQSWEEGFAHFVGSHLLCRCLAGVGGLRHGSGVAWREDAADRFRTISRHWRGKRSPFAPVTVRVPGNWIEAVCACVHLELYREVGLDPDRAPDDVLEALLVDVDAFCDLNDERFRTLAAYLAFLRGRAVPAPGSGSWGRLPDQAALWWLVSDPTRIPDLDHLVPLEIANAPTAPVSVGDEAELTVFADALHRTYASQTYASEALKLRLCEGTDVLVQDVTLAPDRTRDGFKASARIGHRFTQPGSHAVHAEAWASYADGTPRMLGRSDPVTIEVKAPPLHMGLDKNVARPGDRIRAWADPSPLAQPTDKFTWKVTGGLTVERPEGIRNKITMGDSGGTVTLSLVASDGTVRASTPREIRLPTKQNYVFPGHAYLKWTFLQKRYGHGALNFKSDAVRGWWNPGDATGMELVQRGHEHQFNVDYVVRIPLTVEIEGNVKVVESGTFVHGGPRFEVRLDRSYPNWIHRVRLSGFPSAIGPATWDRLENYKTLKRRIAQGIKNARGSVVEHPGAMGAFCVEYQFRQEHYSTDDKGNPTTKHAEHPTSASFCIWIGDGFSGPSWTPAVELDVVATPASTDRRGPVQLLATPRNLDPNTQTLIYDWTGVSWSSAERARLDVKASGDHEIVCRVLDVGGAVLATGRATVVADLACEVDLLGLADGDSVVVGQPVPLAATARCKGGGLPKDLVYRWEPHPDVRFTPHEGKTPSTTARFQVPGTARLWVSVLEPVGGKLVTLAESKAVEVEVLPPGLRLEVTPPEPVVGSPVEVRAILDPPHLTDTEIVWGGTSVGVREESEDGRTLRFVPDTATAVRITATIRGGLYTEDLVEATRVIPVQPAGAGGSLTDRAGSGDAEAQYLLGKFHFTRDAGEADRAAALRWFGKAAGSEHPRALRHLGWCAVKGWGREADIAEGARLYRRAIAAGDAPARRLLAVLLLRGRLGQVDVPGAIALFEEAARAGDEVADKALGDVYRDGRAGQIDEAKARVHYARAAEKGHAGAQAILAEMLRYGMGGAEDRTAARAWAERSAKRGNSDGMWLFSMFLERPEDQAAWTRRAAELGHLNAMTAMGSAYRDGLGVERDPRRAATWFQRAAEAGSGYAASELGALFRAGTGVAKSLPLALFWYRRGEALGVPFGGIVAELERELAGEGR